MHSKFSRQHLFPPLSVNHRFTFILVHEQGQLLLKNKNKFFAFLRLMELKINIWAFFNASTFIFISGDLFALIFCRKCSLLVLCRKNLHYIWCNFSIKLSKIAVPELHLLILLFGINLGSNISQKALKQHYTQCTICTFLVQIRCKLMHILAETLI